MRMPGRRGLAHPPRRERRRRRDPASQVYWKASRTLPTTCSESRAIRSRTEPVPGMRRPFVAAVEGEDEGAAVALLRGGLAAGLGFADFERGLSRAALAHYNDFGHSLIYVSKAGRLIERLGTGVAEPLLLSLARGLVFATREDLIPEYRDYAKTLSGWGRAANGSAPASGDWRGLGIDKSLARAAASSGVPPMHLFHALLGSNARNLLAFDEQHQDRVRIPVDDNVGWLSFTHGITFANAVRTQCAKFPELWPPALAQMACFSGRNAPYSVGEGDVESWRVEDADAFLASAVEGIFDHGCGEFIVSVHLLKTVMATARGAPCGTPGGGGRSARGRTQPLPARTPQAPASPAQRLPGHEGSSPTTADGGGPHAFLRTFVANYIFSFSFSCRQCYVGQGCAGPGSPAATVHRRTRDAENHPQWGSGQGVQASKSRLRYLSDDEIRRLATRLAVHEDERSLKAAAVRLLLLTGCRKSEGRTLRWSDYRESHLFLPDSKTGPRTVWLSGAARAVPRDPRPNGRQGVPRAWRKTAAEPNSPGPILVLRPGHRVCLCSHRFSPPRPTPIPSGPGVSGHVGREGRAVREGGPVAGSRLPDFSGFLRASPVR